MNFPKYSGKSGTLNFSMKNQYPKLKYQNRREFGDMTALWMLGSEFTNNQKNLNINFLQVWNKRNKWLNIICNCIGNKSKKL